MSALAVVAPRIGQLVRLLDSDKDGEVLAAARALKRTLASVGEDFHALAAGIKGAGSAARPPRTEGGHDDEGWARVMAQRVLNSGLPLTVKERAFVCDMTDWTGQPTERQAVWLRAIFVRCPKKGARP